MIYSARILYLLVFGLLASCMPQVVLANVDGSQGIAPVLPPGVPGIDRPFPQDSEKFTFAIIGDKTSGGEENWYIFDRAVDEVNHLHPDFAIMIGDLIQGNISNTETLDTQWKEFYEHASRIQIPFFFIPGNHDISNEVMYEYWRQKIGRSYYSFDYMGCHFVLLNTEESWKKKGSLSDEIQFGSEQMEWIQRDIEAHRSSKQIFLFMHQPAWRYSGQALAQWETIESWLENLPYTAFAGHFHSLDYEMRKGHRCFILSATGGSMLSSEVQEAGAFHQYTMITVDGKDVHAAICRPGSILPYDVARRDFIDRARQMLTWENRLPLAQGINSGELIAHLKNDLDKPLTMSFEYSPSDKSSWNFAPGMATHVVQPGTQAEIVFKASYDFENLLPLPSFAYKVSYGDKHFIQGSTRIVPELIAIRKWMVVGPFDIGTRELPSGGSKLDTAPPAFTQSLEPEKNLEISATYDRSSSSSGLPSTGTDKVAWQAEETEENGWLNFDSIYGGDFAVAYGLCYIHSPDDRKVFAAFRGDDLLKVIVNGMEACSSGYSSSLNYVILSLKEGWNTVMVKCADYTNAWGYTLQIADYSAQLRFTERCPQ